MKKRGKSPSDISENNEKDFQPKCNNEVYDLYVSNE